MSDLERTLMTLVYAAAVVYATDHYDEITEDQHRWRISIAVPLIPPLFFK